MNIVIDLEHTISNASHRIEMKKDGILRGEFQKEFVNDRPNENVVMFMKQLIEQNHFLLILSNKKDKYRPLVDRWLTLHDVDYSRLIMRENQLSDTVSAQDFKEGIIKAFPEKIDFALDDVGRNCAMFARNNIPCLRIEQR